MSDKVRNILYAPLSGILHLSARLPFGALYVLSDVLAFVAGSVVRYRRRLVEANVAASFPEKTEEERQQIVRQFYRNFTDVFLETIKLLHVRDGQIRERMEFVGVEQIDRCTAEGRSVGLYCSHFGNWEWITSLTLWASTDAKISYSQVYRPLRNKWFDRFYFDLRRRFHSESIPKNGVLRALLAARKDGGRFVTGFISDQKPSHNDGLHHITFLHQETPFISGTELLLRKMKAAAAYADVERTGRGRYRVVIRPIADDVSLCAENEVTDAYARYLEATIRRQPDGWLWSHNRWRRPLHK